MQSRSAALLFFCVATISGCAFVGREQVVVETGNQPSGYLSRPMGLTLSSDESVQEVAQRICDNVKQGSTAQVSFVGKVPGPGPLDISDWGRYRYDCESGVRARPPLPAVVASPVPPAVASDSSPAMQEDDPHRRECQRQQGTYQICLGSCMLSSTSASGAVAAECQQRCESKLPVGCN